MKKYFLLIVILSIMVVSCHQSKNQSGTNLLVSNPDNSTLRLVNAGINNGDTVLPPLHFKPDSLEHIDFNQNLSKKTVPELRYLRNLVFARNGQLFHESYLRGYFSEKYKWYDSITTMIWMRVGDKIENEPEISTEEKNFVEKVDNLIKEKQKQNYIGNQGNSMQVATENIVNLAKYKNVTPELLDKLGKNHFAVIPDKVPQLFNVYEENSYNNIPSFVTSDLYLQLFHMYFTYVLRTIEKEKFIPVLEQITLAMYQNSKQIASSSVDPKIKKLAEYNQVFYAIPYELLTKKKLPVPKLYNEMYNSEIANISNASGDYGGSSFLDIDYFPYSLFKPRGYYTREEVLQRYFRAMMWIQTACFCRDSKEQLKNATFAAYVLNKAKDNKGSAVYDEYTTFYKTISFFVGEPDDLSIFDITNILKKKGITDVSKIADDKMIGEISDRLAEIVMTKNKIVPKIKLTCTDKINFMPRRYLFDNEILQEMVDTAINAQRAFPKGLDIFASMGNKTANDILFNMHRDDKKWDKFIPNLDRMKKMMNTFDKWDISIYNKWFDCLQGLTEQGKSDVTLLNTESWNKKSLNTALASWAELKHDVILYSKEPSTAEAGEGGMAEPPPAIIKGYVEPNVAFWKKMIDVIDLTDNVLKKFNLQFEEVSNYSKQLKDQVSFMLSASIKENKHESLTDKEYNYIESIGGEIDNMTLHIVLEHADGWFQVSSPDTTVSVIADVYLRNVPKCPKNGVLYEAVGRVNNIYVVVDIEGYLYLTRGAALSYYEFTKPELDRLTDEEWQNNIVKGKIPPIPDWYEEFTLPLKYKPASNEKLNYFFQYNLMGRLGLP